MQIGENNADSGINFVTVTDTLGPWSTRGWAVPIFGAAIFGEKACRGLTLGGTDIKVELCGIL